MGYGGSTVLTGIMRGISVCLTNACDHFNRFHFIASKASMAYRECLGCKDKRRFVMESIEKFDTHNGVYRKVTIHFGYNSTTAEYKSKAVIEDENLAEGGEVIAHTPLIPHNHERKALKMAEAIYCSLNTTGEVSNMPHHLHIDWDRDAFKQELEDILKVWDITAERIQ